MKHHIQIKLFATLANDMPNKANCRVQIKPGITVEKLMISIGIKPERIKLVFINGRAEQINSELYDGDRVGLFPPVGGG